MGTYRHRLTALKTAALPTRFIVFSSQPVVSRELGRPVHAVHRLRLGALRALRRRGGLHWDSWEGVYHDHDQLLGLIDRYTRKREVTWCFCHHLEYQWILGGLGICGVNGKLDVEGYNFSGRVQTARVRLRGKLLHLVDCANYLDKHITWIAQALGSRIPVPPEDTDSDSAALDKARLECAALCDFIMALCELSGTDMEGAWGWSLGSLAWRSFRAGLMADPIWVHDDKEATGLERAAYLGGRSECRFIGGVSGTVHEVDYNSLYAHCMATEPMPCKLIGIQRESKEALERGLANGLLAVAEVTVNAHQNDYPFSLWPGSGSPPDKPSALPRSCGLRTQWRKVWGRGKFDTTLATPELRRALDAGEVVGVRRVAWYSAANPFSRFVSSWYKLRLAFRAAGQTAQEAIAKRVLTILPGKFGQHAREWRDCPAVRCQDLTGHWWAWDSEAGQWQVYRSLRGCAQRYEAPDEWKHSCPAISAHVTSAARVLTDHAVGIAGDYDCYYYDTDALHVTGRGLDRLRAAGLVHETELGRLKLKGTYDGACYRNARDYTLTPAPRITPATARADYVNGQLESSVPPRGVASRVFVDGLDSFKHAVCVTVTGRFRYSGRVCQAGWVKPLWLTPGPNGELFGRIVDHESVGQ